MMANAPLANREKLATFRDFLNRPAVKQSILQVLPDHITPERIVKVALATIARQPQLLQCTQESIYRAILQAAELGLEPSNLLGSAYLVPYRNNDRNIMEAQCIPGYRGLIDLARRSGQILSIQARVVHQKDSFEVEHGTTDRIKHIPYLDDDPGDLRCVYAVAQVKDSLPQIEVMTRAQIDKIRQRSRAAMKGPWVTDFEEMARKTVVRRLVKYLPLSPQLARAIELEDRAETELEEGAFDVDFDGLDGQPDPLISDAPQPVASPADILKDQIRKRGPLPKGEASPPPGATISPPSDIPASLPPNDAPPGDVDHLVREEQWSHLLQAALAAGITPQDWAALRAQNPYEAAVEIVQGYAVLKGTK